MRVTKIPRTKRTKSWTILFLLELPHSVTQVDFIHNHADQTLLINFAFKHILPPFHCKFRLREKGKQMSHSLTRCPANFTCWSFSGPPKVALNPKEDSFFTWSCIKRYKRTDKLPIRSHASTCGWVPFEILATCTIRSANNLTKTSSSQMKL